jgi:hypothetical protein
VINVGNDRSQLASVAKQTKDTLETENLDVVAARGYFNSAEILACEEELFKLHARRAPTLDLKVAGTPQQIQRGQAISDGLCSGCHSITGTLTGGRKFGKNFPIPVGSFVSSNLTPAGQLSHWSDGTFFGQFATASTETVVG